MLDKKSKANLEIAAACLVMRDEIYYSAGASRAYYAIFQATKYFLVKNNFDYKKLKRKNLIANNQRAYAHGSIGIALAYFIQSNGFNSQDDLIFINEIYRTFHKLYYWRRKGDYEKGVIYKKDLKKAIGRAEMFINKLKKYNG